MTNGELGRSFWLFWAGVNGAFFVANLHWYNALAFCVAAVFYAYSVGKAVSHEH